MTRPPASDPISRRVLLAFALVVLLVLAGCNNPLAPGHQYPPGVNETGVQNGIALADAHRQQLGTGYRVHETATVIAENGTTLVEIETSMRWSQARANRTVTYSRPHPLMGVRSEIYLNETAMYVRITNESGNVMVHRLTDYQPRLLIPNPNSAWENIYAMVGAQNTTTTILENGTTRIRFRNARIGSGTGNGTLYVTPDGLVTRYNATFERRWINTPVTFHRTVAVTNVGKPNVVKPDWVANASTAEAGDTSLTAFPVTACECLATDKASAIDSPARR